MENSCDYYAEYHPSVFLDPPAMFINQCSTNSESARAGYAMGVYPRFDSDPCYSSSIPMSFYEHTVNGIEVSYEVDPFTGSTRVIRRRCTANKKERRRTVSINNAFASLRGCIPNVPNDTKLSKIKTLRLATSYISYLTEVLSKEDPALIEKGFKAELKRVETRDQKKKRELEEINRALSSEKRVKGRTGWPQHVWASELQQLSEEIQSVAQQR